MKPFSTLTSSLSTAFFSFNVWCKFTADKATPAATPTPSSGTVTVLKYGPQQRVICKYKDGREEEISPQQYKDKASISEEAALGSFGDEIVNSEIKEIIFEHPNLELCSNGVEIIDSPGLNEQAERTLVTEQVLKTTDAVIFLTHAQNALTEKERELLLYLKKELNPGKDDEGAKSIFVLVNFADLLRREESHKQVRQRVEIIVKNQNLIAGENRIHFISAQSALEAILDGTENEYVKSFQDFTKSLEQFLTVERGAIALQQSAAGIKQLSSNLVSQFNNLAVAGNFGGIGTSGSRIASSISQIEDGGLMGGLGIGAAVGAALLFFTGLGFIGVILGGLAAGVGGGLSWGFLDGDTVKAQIKEKVCELGFEKFDESSQSIFDKIHER
ncbi:MAG: dynamin family protein, partial [Microcoleus sp.]